MRHSKNEICLTRRQRISTLPLSVCEGLADVFNQAYQKAIKKDLHDSKIYDCLIFAKTETLSCII